MDTTEDSESVAMMMETVGEKNETQNGSVDHTIDLDDEEKKPVEVEVVVEEREKWGKKIEFFLACVGYAVGLGNVWRFPYLCFKNGGGAFLIPYILMLLLCGMPLFAMELALGQYFSLGPVSSWSAICPLLKGVGFSMMVVSFLCCCYYNVIIAWCLYYLYESFDAVVPWSNCGNWWNTEACVKGKMIQDKPEYFDTGNSSANSTNLLRLKDCVNSTLYTVINNTLSVENCTEGAEIKYKSPSQEFWENYVLRISNRLEETGTIRVELLIALIVAWILVYFCLWKGVKVTGKVVYFTATFPYVVLVILLIRGVTLEGASQGIIYYLKPNFNKLGDANVWVAAATQIFYSLGIGFGSLIAMGSYNKFHNNCIKDAVIVSVINCSTSVFAGLVIFSVLGHMAFVLGKNVEDVTTSGPGLAFVVYPEGIAQMPVSPLWAVAFFFMLLTLGLDTQFAMMEAVVTGFVDEYGKYLRKHKELFIAFISFLAFLIGLGNINNAGAYVLNMFNWQSGGISLCFLAFWETVALSWGYGANRFADDIKTMTGSKLHPWWPFAWKFCSPAVITGILVFSIVQWNGMSYGKEYTYPEWGEFMGWLLALSSMVWIPGVALYKVLVTPGHNLRERLYLLLNPEPDALKAVAEREGFEPRVEYVKV